MTILTVKMPPDTDSDYLTTVDAMPPIERAFYRAFDTLMIEVGKAIDRLDEHNEYRWEGHSFSVVFKRYTVERGRVVDNQPKAIAGVSLDGQNFRVTKAGECLGGHFDAVYPVDTSPQVLANVIIEMLK
ncbi:MAG: hypothetical protein WC525_09080 [Candidatus Thermoplasmatota archaeon]